MSNTAWAEGNTLTRIERSGFQAALNLAYRHTVWCINQGCHAPIPSGTTVCPECETVQRRRRACACTDGWRNHPLLNCEACLGTGEVAG